MIQTFAHKLKWWFEEKPNQKAITFVYRKNPQHVVDYHTLFRGAGAYAKALEAAHIQPHEVVIIILQHSEALVYAFWGCVLRGAIPSIMPFLTEKLSPQYYRHSIQTLLEITKPAAIITSTEFLGEVRQALKADCSVRVVLEADPIESLTNDELDDVISKGTAVLRGLAAEAQDIVLLQHSSGTTGLQKGVALSHQACFVN
jgi:acyl-CoA synthetase (AMP-forming)/AMP-acid ligase II